MEASHRTAARRDRRAGSADRPHVAALPALEMVCRRAGLVGRMPGEAWARARRTDRGRAHLADRGAMAGGIRGRARRAPGRLHLLRSEKGRLRPQPHEWPDPTGAKGPFREALLDMVGRIWQTPRRRQGATRGTAAAQSRGDRLAAASGRVIYLHARQTHAEVWERAGDALVQRGFVVVPPSPTRSSAIPIARATIAEHRVETLSGCDGLLLLGADDGRALDADLVVVGRQDRQLARARSQRLLPCAVLDTAGPVIATLRRKAMARALDIDWIDTTQVIWPTGGEQLAGRGERGGGARPMTLPSPEPLDATFDGRAASRSLSRACAPSRPKSGQSSSVGRR